MSQIRTRSSKQSVSDESEDQDELVCGKCKKAFTNEEYVDCTICNRSFHPECTKLSPENFKVLKQMHCVSEEMKKMMAFRCIFCAKMTLLQLQKML